MITIKCSRSQRTSIIRMLTSFCKKINGYGDSTIDESLEYFCVEGGLELDSVYPSPYLYYIDGELQFLDSDVDFLKLFRKIKDKYPEVDINGTLEFGDNNYRHNFLIRSDSGETEVVGGFEECDKVINDIYWFIYYYWTDYGQEYVGLGSPDGAIAFLEEVYEKLEDRGKLDDLEELKELFDNDEISRISCFYVRRSVLLEFFDMLCAQLQQDPRGTELLQQSPKASAIIMHINSMKEELKAKEEREKQARLHREAISLNDLDVMYSALGYAKKTRVKLNFNDPDILNKAVVRVMKRANKGDLEAKFIAGKLCITELNDNELGKKLIREAADAGYQLAKECVHRNRKVFYSKKTK